MGFNHDKTLIKTMIKDGIEWFVMEKSFRILKTKRGEESNDYRK